MEPRSRDKDAQLAFEQEIHGPALMAPVGVFRLRRLCRPSGCRLGKGFPSAIATPADDVSMEMDPTQDASDETRSRLIGLSQPTYVVLVPLKTNSLRTEDGDTMLEPGVAVTAEIKTGKRMVMSYCSHRFSGSDRRDCERDEHGASLLDLWFIFMGCLPGLQGVFVKRTFRPEARELARVASIRNIFHFFALLMISWADVVHAGDAVSENGAPHHETPSCRAAVAALHRDGVVFYSSLGQRLATCLKIPPPPLVRLPLSQVDPDRHVPAKLWRSPMCDRWNDATTMCERDRTRKGTPVVRCRPLNKKLIGVVFDLQKGTVRFFTFWLRRRVSLADIRDANCEFGFPVSPTRLIFGIFGSKGRGGRSESQQRTYMVNLSGPFGSRQVRFHHKRWPDRFLSILRDEAPRCRITRWR